ncbi:hypothetical protein Y032_0091g2486 [Ancylostoma ceylanicum]|uniref:Fatty-acid and retinol-binding protein 1 n=1 Tax=Ancylostoma ceylanicum TaxID=53326 RepID=A0A016TMZ8_9BILA|nr:hypothetical protein Y032_0091g2486 [Ancylostoma ceylanicum]
MNLLSYFVLAALFFSTAMVDALAIVDRLFGVAVNAGGLLVNNRPFTLSTLNRYLSMMENNPYFIPQEVQELLFNLRPETRTQIVDVFNDVAAGRVLVSNDKMKIAFYIAKRVPELNERFPQALATIRKNLGCMSQDTRDQMRPWYERAIATLAAPRQRLVSGISAWMADLKEAFDEADDSVKEDIQRCEPEAYRIITSDYINNFAEGARIFSDAPVAVGHIEF